MKNTKKISKDLYELYYILQEELHNIQHDKSTWPKDWTYKEMCERVNKLNPIIRNISKAIKN